MIEEELKNNSSGVITGGSGVILSGQNNRRFFCSSFFVDKASVHYIPQLQTVRIVMVKSAESKSRRRRGK